MVLLYVLFRPFCRTKKKRKGAAGTFSFFASNVRHAHVTSSPKFYILKKKQKHSEQLQASQIQSQTCMWPRYAGVTQG